MRWRIKGHYAIALRLQRGNQRRQAASAALPSMYQQDGGTRVFPHVPTQTISAVIDDYTLRLIEDALFNFRRWTWMDFDCGLPPPALWATSPVVGYGGDTSRIGALLCRSGTSALDGTRSWPQERTSPISPSAVPAVLRYCVGAILRAT